jgi:cytochrome c-type biogenesis protein CcsB
MQEIEIILFWATIFTYISAFCLHLFGFVGQKDKGVTYAFRILWCGLLIHSALSLVRWIDAGHAPVTDTYELNMIGMWFAILIFLCFEKARKIDRSIGLVVTPISFLILGYGFMERKEAIPMNPSFDSPWLIVHVIFAWLAFGCYAIATGAAILFLMKEKFTHWKSINRIPDAKALDIAGYRYIVLGFINHAVMLVSGAIWANKLWGRYWSWDPLETWSLISFLFYAFYLHARSFLKWEMKRAAWLILFGMVILFISYWGVDWFTPTRHPGP